MTAAVQTTEYPVERHERGRDPLLFPRSGKSPEMEETMFEALMKFGGYRVDYLNKHRAGSAAALGLYVSGDLPVNQSYSRMAKHNLFNGLVAIRQQQEEHNLVAVYLEVNSPFNLQRPAYQQMKRDIQAGLFRRLCLPVISDLISDEEMQADFWRFYRELPWIELLSVEAGSFLPVQFPHLNVSYLFSAV